MRADQLLDAIGGARDEYIRDAEKKEKHNRPRWPMWMAASLAVLLTLSWWVSWQGGDEEPQTPGNGTWGGGCDGETYMSYAGPVFPLTMVDTVEQLTARRQTVFDFSSVDNALHRDNNVTIRETYRLTSAAPEERTITALYPFAGSLDTHNWPEIRVNGEAVEWQLIPGPYSGGFRGAGDEHTTSMNLDRISSWEGYAALLEDGSYFAAALEPAPQLTEPAIVYTFTELTDGDVDAVAPTLCVSFHRDAQTTEVLTYGFNGGTGAPGDRQESRNFFIRDGLRHPYEDTKYLIVLGNDVEDMVLKGYPDGGCEPGREIEGPDATVTRREMPLGQVLEEILTERWHDLSTTTDGEGNPCLDQRVTLPMYTKTFLDFFTIHGSLSTEAKERYDWGMLDGMVDETARIQRVMYAAFSLTLPAEGEAVLEITQTREPSFDYFVDSREREGVLGYDMVTQVGSTLTFASQRAALEGWENVEIISQNFGFAPENGVTEVELDLSQPHYFLQIRRKENPA